MQKTGELKTVKGQAAGAHSFRNFDILISSIDDGFDFSCTAEEGPKVNLHYQ